MLKLSSPIVALADHLPLSINNYKDQVPLMKGGSVGVCPSVRWIRRVCILNPPPICTACGSNISPNVFLIRAAAAAHMNMVRIHRQISPFPQTHIHTHIHACTHTKAHGNTHFYERTPAQYTRCKRAKQSPFQLFVTWGSLAETNEATLQKACGWMCSGMCCISCWLLFDVCILRCSSCHAEPGTGDLV